MLKKLVLNLAIEFGPIIAFLVASETTTFIMATGIFVLLTIVSLIAGFVERSGIAWFPLLVAVTVVAFGGLTIIFHNPFFIIIKDTIYNMAFAAILFGGLFYNRGLLKHLFKDLFSITEKGWYILSYRWALMFTLLAVSNEAARMILTPEHWIYFKTVATLATVGFSLYQFKLSKQERLPDSTPWGMKIHPAKAGK